MLKRNNFEDHSFKLPKSTKFRRRQIRALCWGMGSIFLASTGAGLSYGWFTVHHRLSPMLESQLTTLLDRPVDLGEVESFSPIGGLSFGESSILATSEDTNHIAIKNIRVQLNPWQLLIKNRLNLRVKLIQPTIYIQQTQDNGWLPPDLIKLQSPSDPKVNLEHLTLINAKVTLVSRSNDGALKTPVQTLIKFARVHTHSSSQLMEFKVRGQLNQSGDFQIRGTMNPQTQAFNLLVRGNQIDATQLSDLLSLPITLAEGTVDGNLEIKLRKEQPPQFKGIANLHDVELIIAALPGALTQTSGQLRFQDYQISVDIDSKLDSIPVLAQGIIDTQKGLNLQAQTLPTPVTEILKSLKLPNPVLTIQGEAKTQINITGFLRQPQLEIEVFNHESITVEQTEMESVYGVLSLENKQLAIKQFEAIPVLGGKTSGSGYVELPNAKLGDPGSFQLTLTGSQIPLTAINPSNELPIEIKMVETQLFGPLTSLAEVQGKARAQLSLGNGTIEVEDLEYGGLVWEAKVSTTDLQLQDLGIDHSYFSPNVIKSNLMVSGKLDTLQLDKIAAEGEVSLQVAEGSISTNNWQLHNGKWSSELIANNLELKGHHAQGNLYLSGTIGDSLDQLQAQGYGNFNLSSGGNILVESFDLDQQELSTALLTQDLQLKALSPQLQGQLAGNLLINVYLTNPSLKGVQAQGELTFSEGIAVIERPVSTLVNWNGEFLNLEKITGDNIEGTGWIRISENGQLEDLGLELNKATINLAKFSEQLSLEGQLNFQGEINKNSNNIQVNGDLAISELEVPGLNFEPLLKGTIITKDSQELELNLAGENDKVQVSLASNYQPNQFLVEQGESSLRGDRYQDNLAITAENIPIEIINSIQFLPLNYELPLSGQLSAQATVDLNTLYTVGNFQIAAPFLGQLKGEKLTANFNYRYQILNINNLELKQESTAYVGEVELNLRETVPQVQAKLTIQEGKVQDILETIQIFQLGDLLLGLSPRKYGNAATLNEDNTKVKQGLPNQSILEQLRLLAQLNYQLKEEQKTVNDTIELPDLDELKGSIDAEILVSGYLDSRLQADFNIRGKNWQWGNYKVNDLLVIGAFVDSIFNISTISLKSGESSLDFLGNFTQKQQNGRLTVTNLPLNLVESMLKLPVNVAIKGKLNGAVNLGGSRENPQAQGNFTLEEMVIDQISVYSTQAIFNYKNANLNFSLKSLLTDKATPIELKGNFPYQLPFATIKPEKQQFNLSLNIQDQGLKLMNIFTEDIVSWQSGKGKVNIDILGTFDQAEGRLLNIKTAGEANFQDGVIVSQFFPDRPFQQIQGQILFDFNSIQVEELTGNFSGGDFSASGSIPLSQAGTANEFLNIDLDYLTLQIKGLYEGGVEGNIQIFGSILEPNLTGKLNLSQGEVLLGDPSNSTAVLEGYASRIEFDGLQLNLKEEIKLIRPPVLSFTADGTLNLFGNLNNPRPEGTIELKQGGVNLFTTNFRLANNTTNRARFFPNQGLDPYLEVELVGSVTETESQDLLRDPASSEVSDIPVSSFGTLETIRVEANVRGFASQLTNSLELSSSPPRTEQEIIALLGGSFVNTLGRGETTLGLASLAGSAIFGSFQGELADTLGLNELRIFPTPIIQEQDRRETFGLAAEIGVDLTGNFSISVLKVLTNTEPPQFGVRYRLNETWLLRGSTNFSKDNRGILEYQLRF